MYPLAIILTIGFWRRDKGVFLYSLPFAIFGIGISTYHYLLQKTTLFSHSAVCETGIPCTTTWINLLGFMTIPFFALIGFFIVVFAGLLFLSLQMDGDEV